MPEFDIYDDAMLEEYWNWFTEDDINDLKLFVRIVGPPVLVFGALLAFNYFLNKKG